MATTIQVQDDTILLLKHFRKREHAESYDETIKFLIKKATAPKKSLFGALGKMSMKEILKDLRDKDDRF